MNICNKQNNLVDTDWFGRDVVFNVEHDDNTWTSVPDKIVFPEDKSWRGIQRHNYISQTKAVSFYYTQEGGLWRF